MSKIVPFGTFLIAIVGYATHVQSAASVKGYRINFRYVTAISLSPMIILRQYVQTSSAVGVSKYSSAGEKGKTSLNFPQLIRNFIPSISFSEKEILIYLDVESETAFNTGIMLIQDMDFIRGSSVTVLSTDREAPLLHSELAPFSKDVKADLSGKRYDSETTRQLDLSKLAIVYNGHFNNEKPTERVAQISVILTTYQDIEGNTTLVKELRKKKTYVVAIGFQKQSFSAVWSSLAADSKHLMELNSAANKVGFMGQIRILISEDIKHDCDTDMFRPYGNQWCSDRCVNVCFTNALAKPCVHNCPYYKHISNRQLQTSIKRQTTKQPRVEIKEELGHTAIIGISVGIVGIAALVGIIILILFFRLWNGKAKEDDVEVAIPLNPRVADTEESGDDTAGMDESEDDTTGTELPIPLNPRVADTEEYGGDTAGTEESWDDTTGTEESEDDTEDTSGQWQDYGNIAMQFPPRVADTDESEDNTEDTPDSEHDGESRNAPGDIQRLIDESDSVTSNDVANSTECIEEDSQDLSKVIDLNVNAFSDPMHKVRTTDPKTELNTYVEVTADVVGLMETLKPLPSTSGIQECGLQELNEKRCQDNIAQLNIGDDREGNPQSQVFEVVETYEPEGQEKQHQSNEDVRP